jgi:hypothetical protein
MSRKGTNSSAPLPGPSLDPYRGVVFVLLALALLGTAGALAGGATFPDPLLLDTAVTLGIATGILVGVALAQAARARPPKSREAESESLPAKPALVVVLQRIESLLHQLGRAGRGLCEPNIEHVHKRTRTVRAKKYRYPGERLKTFHSRPTHPTREFRRGAGFRVNCTRGGAGSR